MDDSLIFVIGLLLFVVGFAILVLLVGFVRPARGTRDLRGGGVIMIGPIPIIFGRDKESAQVLMLLGVALMALLVLLAFMGDLEVGWILVSAL